MNSLGAAPARISRYPLRSARLHTPLPSLSTAYPTCPAHWSCPQPPHLPCHVDGPRRSAPLFALPYLCSSPSHGIPPVMWTFLRNVEAVHEFAILLQNRFLPIPYLTEDERLAAVPVPGIPHFFRVSGTGRHFSRTRVHAGVIVEV